ncbi:hypothetical protein [Tengunoibacter tsumagoiensis]|uniref:DUF4199 domain-containing protein n=1 Tax=Tengunoibacter tsumagoiensis TaxID=2014871 RepID=A0A402A5N7_9CHLR|nr:hypothetical protein [Tengunoibacter tsumagoiensis]GCE14454.1 hypothetical protein KTT_43130 [Tengunoibacter tsumagoiensis]
MQNAENVAPKNVALKQGLVFGAGLTVIEFVQALVNALVHPAVVVTYVIGFIVFLLALAAYAVSGFLASKQTGKVSTGTLAGLWTGLISGVIGLIYTLILTFTLNSNNINQAFANMPSNSGMSSESLKTIGLVSLVVALVFGSLFELGIGAGVGALGGLIGKNKAPRVDPVYPEYPSQQPY